MIKKSFITGIIILLLMISILAEVQFVEVAEANMIPIPTAEVYSPLPSTIYHNATVKLDVCLKNRVVSNPVTKITYCLDSGYTVEFANITRSSEYQSFNYKVVDYRAIGALENLKPGNHSVVVYVLSEYRSGGNLPEIDFAVASPTVLNSPSPTQIGLLTSTPTRNEFGSNDSSTLPNLELMIAIIVVAGIFLVGGLLIKRKPEEKRQQLMKKAVVVMLILALLLSTLMGSLFVKEATANPEGSIPNLSMPVEYINYTITSTDGTLWAKIDGYYPIYLQKQTNCSFNGDLPMVYPMPPQTTNISVSLDNKEVSWSNYTQIYPDALHHTAIGDWWMIYSNLENVSDYFELKIHYEHPLEMINGSYIFLYDLNISPYLSSESSNSTAYFTIQMQANYTNLNVYSTKTDNEWNPINFSLTENASTNVVSVQMYSEYGKPLLGDLVVEFSQNKQVSEFHFWTFTTILIGALLVTLFYMRKIVEKTILSLDAKA